MPDTPENGTVLAFDFGLRRIGVAVGQTVTRSATTLITLAAREGLPEPGAIERLIREWQPDRILLGMPFAPGETSVLEAPLDEFRVMLESHGIPVELVDEQFTSAEAAARLVGERRSGRRRRRLRKGDVDSLSASIIAEQWLRRH